MIATLLLLGGVTVTLAEKAEVRGLEVTLDEIATVSAANSELAAQVAAINLGYAPAPGYHRILRSDLVLFDLRRALPGVQIEVVGAERCRVDIQTDTIDSERLWSLATGQMETFFEGLDASIRRDGELAVVQVPVGSVPTELKAAIVGRMPEAGTKQVAVQLWVDGDLYRTVHVPFMVALREPRWVLKASVPAGQVLDPSLFELRRVEVTSDSASAGLPVEALHGTVAARPIPASSVVTERDIQRPIAVRRGDLVTVTVKARGVQAEALGTAVTDARIGESLRVVLNDTKRELTGRARAGGKIEIVLP